MYQLKTMIQNKLKNIPENTGAILPVHLLESPNMDEVCSIAKDYDLRIVEDTAQSFGTKYDKKHLERLEMLTFSFFQQKLLAHMVMQGNCYG